MPCRSAPRAERARARPRRSRARRSLPNALISRTQRSSLPPASKLEWRWRMRRRSRSCDLDRPCRGTARSRPTASGSSSVGAWPTRGDRAQPRLGHFAAHLARASRRTRMSDSSPRIDQHRACRRARRYAGHKSAGGEPAAAWSGSAIFMS